MRGGLREMRRDCRYLCMVRSDSAANRMSVRSETRRQATTVGLSGVTERAKFRPAVVDHGVSTAGRTMDRKGRIGGEGRG